MRQGLGVVLAAILRSLHVPSWYPCTRSAFKVALARASKQVATRGKLTVSSVLRASAQRCAQGSRRTVDAWLACGESRRPNAPTRGTGIELRAGKPGWRLWIRDPYCKAEQCSRRVVGIHGGCTQEATPCVAVPMTVAPPSDCYRRGRHCMRRMRALSGPHRSQGGSSDAE